MRLYLAGHNHKRGYAISREYSDAECSRLALVEDDPSMCRYYACHRRAARFIRRWNAMYATH